MVEVDAEGEDDDGGGELRGILVFLRMLALRVKGGNWCCGGHHTCRKRRKSEASFMVVMVRSVLQVMVRRAGRS